MLPAHYDYILLTPTILLHDDYRNTQLTYRLTYLLNNTDLFDKWVLIVWIYFLDEVPVGVGEALREVNRISCILAFISEGEWIVTTSAWVLLKEPILVVTDFSATFAPLRNLWITVLLHWIYTRLLTIIKEGIIFKLL